MLVLDVSLVGENVVARQAARVRNFRNAAIKDILLELCSLSDLIYFSSRKVSSSRGGANRDEPDRSV